NGERKRFVRETHGNWLHGGAVQFALQSDQVGKQYGVWVICHDSFPFRGPCCSQPPHQFGLRGPLGLLACSFASRFFSANRMSNNSTVVSRWASASLSSHSRCTSSMNLRRR